MWKFQTQAIRKYERDDGAKLVLSVIENPGPMFACYAVETKGDSKEAVLKSHSHAIIGSSDSLAEALTESEKYADKWQALTGTAELCTCEDMNESA